MNAQDVLHAWRDFECSFFAGALLAPRVPFRRFLARERHRVEAGAKLELTPAVVMRRMTKVSPYPYWHFFDAYPPGYLRAVYRGNGIPLPWGNLAQVSDPCPQLGGVPHDRRRARRLRLADLGAARRRALAALLLPLACACTTWPAIRTCCRSASISRRRSPPTASGQRGADRVDLPRVPAPARRGAHPEGGRAGAHGRGERAEHRLDRGRARHSRRASSARAATAARARSAARARRPSRAREIADVREEILGREG